MLRQKLAHVRAAHASIPGLDLLDDIDRVLITSPGVAGPPEADIRRRRHCNR